MKITNYTTPKLAIATLQFVHGPFNIECTQFKLRELTIANSQE